MCSPWAYHASLGSHPAIRHAIIRAHVQSKRYWEAVSYFCDAVIPNRADVQPALAAMPRCYMVKKCVQRHEGPPPCSPTEASVAPPCYSPAEHSALTEPRTEYAELGVPLSERSAADTEAAHELLSLAHSLPPLPPAAHLVTVLHAPDPPPLVPVYTYTLQPTNIYILAEDPPEPVYHTVQTVTPLQPVEFVDTHISYVECQTVGPPPPPPPPPPPLPPLHPRPDFNRIEYERRASEPTPVAAPVITPVLAPVLAPVPPVSVPPAPAPPAPVQPPSAPSTVPPPPTPENDSDSLSRGHGSAQPEQDTPPSYAPPCLSGSLPNDDTRAEQTSPPDSTHVITEASVSGVSTYVRQKRGRQNVSLNTDTSPAIPKLREDFATLNKSADEEQGSPDLMLGSGYTDL
ncbi:unnamed protein product [Spodoptera exigua]|nr:unnamed protein product [Spodoptera exigua]